MVFNFVDIKFLTTDIDYYNSSLVYRFQFIKSYTLFNYITTGTLMFPLYKPHTGIYPHGR